jgi:two-component system response regulator DesR
MLAGYPDIRIVGEVAFDISTAAAVAEHWPHVVVFNTDYMVSQILPTVAEVQARIAGCSVLMLADPAKPGMLPPRRRAYGLSFLIKDAPPRVLAETIHRLASGERVIQTRLQVASLGTDKQMSTRELEILGLAAEGEPVAAIAQRLYLTRGTVRNYLSAAIAKAGARNCMDAIRVARQQGWLY